MSLVSKDYREVYSTYDCSISVREGGMQIVEPAQAKISGNFEV